MLKSTGELKESCMGFASDMSLGEQYDAYAGHITELNRVSMNNADARHVIFQRGGVLVHLRAHGRAGVHIETITENYLSSYFARTAAWRSTRASQLNRSVLRMLIADPPEDLPELDAVTGTPLFAPSGSLVACAGYCAEATTWLIDSDMLRKITVPDHLTEAEISGARRLIVDELLGDFPFATDSDRAHAVATLLLPFARALIDGPTPIHLIEAPTAGSGKTLLCDSIGIIVDGEPFGANVLPTADAEIGKLLLSLLMQGRSVIVFDNLANASVLRSSSLASATTALVHSGRILQHSRIARIRARAAWIMTGNNLSLDQELMRRTVRVRIEPSQESPWLRPKSDFRHPDLRGWVRAHRAELVGACMILIRAWVAGGMHPWMVSTLGSYERWAEVIGGILKASGVPGFLDNLDGFYETADAVLDSTREFLHAWWNRFGDKEIGATELVQLCVRDGLMNDVLGEGADRSQAIKLGMELGRLRDQKLCGLCVRSRGAKKTGRRYRLEQRPECPAIDDASAVYCDC